MGHRECPHDRPPGGEVLAGMSHPRPNIRPSELNLLEIRQALQRLKFQFDRQPPPPPGDFIPWVVVGPVSQQYLSDFWQMAFVEEGVGSVEVLLPEVTGNDMGKCIGVKFVHFGRVQTEVLFTPHGQDFVDETRGGVVVRRPHEGEIGFSVTVMCGGRRDGSGRWYIVWHHHTIALNVSGGGIGAPKPRITLLAVDTAVTV